MTRQKIAIFAVVCAVLLLASLVSLAGTPYARSVAAQTQSDGEVAAELVKLTAQSALLVQSTKEVSAQIAKLAEQTTNLAQQTTKVSQSMDGMSAQTTKVAQETTKVWQALNGLNTTLAKIDTQLTKIDTHMETDLVTTLGVGEAQAQPDIALVRIGAESQGATAAEAITKANAQARTILAGLKGAGVAEKDVQTASPDISPIFNDQRKITSYRVITVLVVTVRNPAKSAKQLDAVIKFGGNNFSGIEFKLADPDKLKVQARELAFKDARTRAEQYAKLMGKTVSTVREVSEDFIPQETDPADPNEPKILKEKIELKVVFELK